HHVVRIVAFQRRNDLFRDQFPRAEGIHIARKVLQRMGIVFRRAPMPLEALRGNARAAGAAIIKPFRLAAIVPVEERRRIGMECMDLQETWASHAASSSLASGLLGTSGPDCALSCAR